eukprot:jgi/Phyca11/17545/fgenesh1_pg.PHYCAscaffold_28_\
MAFCDVVALDVIIVALTSITISTFFALVVPIIVHVFGHTADIGVYVGVMNSANSFGQLLNFIVGSALVETSMGYRLPIFVGGLLTQLSGPLCGVLVGPIVGVYSDQSTSKYGRRRPFLVVAGVGSIICWVLMGYTRQLGDALGDVGTGKPGEVTDRKWTALLSVVFYLFTGFMIHLARTPAMLLISDFAGDRQTIGAALGQGWAVLGALIVAGYTQCFGAAYKSLPWFMAMLSVFNVVSIGAACYVAKEVPVKKKNRSSCCQNVTSSLGKIFSAVRGLPKVLVVYCVVLFFIQYAYAAYNGNKGMFFGLEVFDGDATNAATCDTECSEAQRDYNRGVQVAGGVADILFCLVGYLYSWLMPPLGLFITTGHKNINIFANGPNLTR